MKPPRPATDTAPEPSHVSYQGHLLIAMPGLNAPPFDHSVIYLCQHDDEHAMGLILNQPIGGLRLERILKELGLHYPDKTIARFPVFSGGPVQGDRGFVLHSLDYRLDDVTLDLGGPDIKTRGGSIPGLGLTVSRDILIDLSSGSGPEKVRIALGYAGWGPGQLESEIGQNAWLIAPAREDLIFVDAPDQLWSAAVASLGIDPAHLSGTAGTA
jgi:putative transcriptional regulator